MEQSIGTGVGVWWLSVLAAAVAIILAGAVTPWRKATLVLAVLIVGWASQLGLTQPLWFQFLWLRPRNAFETMLWSFVGLQAVVAIAILVRTRAWASVGGILRTFGVVRCAAFMLLGLAAAIGVMRYVGQQTYGDLFKQFVAQALLLGVNILGLWALARAWPDAALARVADRIGAAISLPGAPAAHRPLDRILPWAAAAFTCAVTSTLALVVFEGKPTLADEVTNLFHAKLLAMGVLSAPPPPPAAWEALRHDFIMVERGHWFSIVPPGWPLVLAIGVKLGAPWLVNPVLGALCVLLIHAVLRQVASLGLANIATLLLALSPWFLATCGTLMNQTVTLAAALLACWLLLRARDGERGWAFVAGAAMGLVFLARPLDGLLMGAAAGAWTIAFFLKNRRQFLTVTLYGLGCIAVGGLTFPWNFHMIGDPLLPPLNHYFDLIWGPGANRLGFGADIGPPNQWGGGVDIWKGHSAPEALVGGQNMANALNIELFGWAVGSLSLVFAQILWGRWRALQAAMGLFVVAVAGAYALYHFADSFFIGPRYWFTMLAPLIVLSASGLAGLGHRLAQEMSADAIRRLGGVILALCLFGVGGFLPWRSVTRYFEHRGFNADYVRLAETHDLRGALVFVKAHTNPDFSSAFALNAPDLPAEKPIFVRDLGPDENRRVAAAFPGRPIYYVEGRDAQRPHATIVRGPLR